MDEFIQMDVFFFIASIGTVLLIVGLVIIMIFVIVVIKKINKIVDQTKQFADVLVREGEETIDLVKTRTSEILNTNGIPQKVLGMILGAVVTKIVGKKIKKK